MAGSARIVANARPKKLGINAGDPPALDPKLTVSFEYWRQVEYFAFDPSPQAWLVDLLERVRVVSQFTREQWNGEAKNRPPWRYHRVTLEGACPIRRHELNWLPKTVVEDEEQFPFYQFSLGTGDGRVLGYWETNDRFSVVLLDPHHNLYPDESFGGVRECVASPGQTGLVHLALDYVRETRMCMHDTCEVHRELATIAVRKRVDGALHFAEGFSVGLDTTDKRRVEELLALRRGISVNAILKRGIQACEDEWLVEMTATAAGAGGAGSETPSSANDAPTATSDVLQRSPP